MFKKSVFFTALPVMDAYLSLKPPANGATSSSIERLLSTRLTGQEQRFSLMRLCDVSFHPFEPTSACESCRSAGNGQASRTVL
jgi:hypothetical protein